MIDLHAPGSSTRQVAATFKTRTMLGPLSELGIVVMLIALALFLISS